MRNNLITDDLIAKAKKYLKDGLSQLATAHLLGVSQYTIFNINKGRYETGKLIKPKQKVNQKYFTHDPYYTQL